MKTAAPHAAVFIFSIWIRVIICFSSHSIYIYAIEGNLTSMDVTKGMMSIGVI